MISIETRPETREEIRRAVDVRCAEMGISRSAYAVQDLRISPHVLNFMLSGRTSAAAHPDIVKKVNKFTGATMEAWEK